MKRLWIPFILFLIVVLEGIAFDLLPERFVDIELLIIPHWVFAYLVYVTIFYDSEDTYTSVFYAIIFGLMIDMVYTGILGVYMFTYGLVIYIIHELKHLLHANFYVTLLLGMIGIALSDFLIYWAFLIIDITNMTMSHYFIYRFIPTLVANLLFLVILYPFVHKPLIRWQQEQVRS